MGLLWTVSFFLNSIIVFIFILHATWISRAGQVTGLNVFCPLFGRRGTYYLQLPDILNRGAQTQVLDKFLTLSKYLIQIEGFTK